MNPVTLINPFEVPPEREAEFLARWQQATDLLRAQPGFIGSELHRSREHDARFRFTNITTWESAEHFAAAIQQPEFVRIMGQMSFPHYAALYDLFLRSKPSARPWRPGLASAAAPAIAAGAWPPRVLPPKTVPT